jgi:hypothetical protein
LPTSYWTAIPDQGSADINITQTDRAFDLVQRIPLSTIMNMIELQYHAYQFHLEVKIQSQPRPSFTEIIAEPSDQDSVYCPPTLRHVRK